MADTLKELVRKRGSLKAKLTLFNTYINVAKTCEQLSDLQITELQCRLDKIESVYPEFDALQMEIEALTEKPDEAYAEREQFESQFFVLVSTARLLLSPPVQSSGGRLGPGSTTASTSCGAGRQDFVRLPKIDLPHFDGNYQHWLGFRDTYISLIHNNPAINDISKFHYLRASLKSSAALVIQSLDFSSDNYHKAWQLVSERYDNPRLLINNHIQALFNLEPMQHESSSLLRNMVDVTNKNLRALGTLGEPTDHWDTLVIYIMSKKLDLVTKREWEEHRNLLTGSPTLQQYITFLNSRADLLESLGNNNVNNSGYKTSKHKLHSHIEPQKTHNYLTATKNNAYRKPIVCPYCKQDHFLFNCESFRKLDIDNRIKNVSSYSVCKNCLRPGHLEKQCVLSHCKYCKLKHNTLLHKHVDKASSSSDVPVPDVHFSGNIQTKVFSPTKTSGLLSTALVHVSDANGVLREARLLLDNGSTINFVTQDLCGQLGLATRSVGATVTVKALHLELVTSLTTESFLAALRRFMSRRGKPQTLYCDNGTSFVGASNELSNFLKHNHDKLQSGMAENLINFKFSPAYSPHFGGLWEAAVKSTKYHLKRILSLTHLTYEELNCCLIQIEAILNSRPLTPLSSDPSDLTYLSPSHFLIGRSLLSVPQESLTEENISRLERFQRVEKLKQHFWSRFSNEYVTLLQQKTKWHTSTDQLQVGTMVLVKDRALPPLLWLLGRVTKLYPGTDNVTRVADIRTKKGVIRRAYNNLCPLPIS
ncbi:uncharacterized protein LOC134649428 [Cydia amplana]|uniref:uncharacterized protein LOC134649428 n=1 Tax=Cydia amplana TaxID=1869771 RepID=UPI002FE65A1C